MMPIYLSLKHKLYTLVALSLIGFSLLLVLSFNVLDTLDSASKRVDSIRYDVNLLKDLQIEVLQINQNTDASRLKALPEIYKGQLDQIVQKVASKHAEIVSGIQMSLSTFTVSRLLWLAEAEKLGASAEMGLRADMEVQLNELEAQLFANFRKPFAALKQAYVAFMDQRNETEYQQLTLSLTDFKALTNEHLAKLSANNFVDNSYPL